MCSFSSSTVQNDDATVGKDRSKAFFLSFWSGGRFLLRSRGEARLCGEREKMASLAKAEPGGGGEGKRDEVVSFRDLANTRCCKT